MDQPQKTLQLRVDPVEISITTIVATTEEEEFTAHSEEEEEDALNNETKVRCTTKINLLSYFYNFTFYMRLKTIL